MTDQIRNVALSFPCREDWEKFEVVPGGRFCASCCHVVMDFRDCSMAEIQEAMKGGQRVCGRFRKDQLSPKFLKAAAVVAVMATASACQNEMPKLQVDPSPIDSVELDADELVNLKTMGIVIEVDSVENDAAKNLEERRER